MATLIGAGSLYSTAAGNKAVATTAALVAGDLLVVLCAASGTTEANASTTAVTDDNPDGLGTYTKITESAAGSSPRCSVWIRNAAITDTTVTTVTAAQGASNGGGLQVMIARSMGGRTGSSAAKQSGSNSGAAATSPAVTLGAAVTTTNPCVGVVANSTNPATVTPPGSWTEQNDLGYATPTSGREIARRDSGETGTTITWGSTSGSAWRASVVELDASAPPSATTQVAVSGAVAA
jgi:hypothetical protein